MDYINELSDIYFETPQGLVYGTDLVKLIHLNDSNGNYYSHIDLHAPIGGNMGNRS